jgi:hypothetical protein
MAATREHNSRDAVVDEWACAKAGYIRGVWDAQGWYRGNTAAADAVWDERLLTDETLYITVCKER